MSKRLMMLLALLAIASLGVAACGPGQQTGPAVATDVSEGADAAATAAVEGIEGAATAVEEGVESAATEISEMVAGDVVVETYDTFKFEPADVTVAAGSSVNITLNNADQALEHSWVLLTSGTTKEDAVLVQAEGDEDKKLFSLHVLPGETASGSFTAPTEPGTYVVVCTVAGHAAGGMLGTLTVQ